MALVAELARLRQEHGELDSQVAALEAQGGGIQLQLQRLKKRKLALKDRIAYIDDRLTPDIIA
ncbi:YdcH family protein [Pseudochelatococcus contaminans]